MWTIPEYQLCENCSMLTGLEPSTNAENIFFPQVWLHPLFPLNSNSLSTRLCWKNVAQTLYISGISSAKVVSMSIMVCFVFQISLPDILCFNPI